MITQPTATPQLTVGQHLQQDPTDPSKWQILQNIAATAQPTATALTPGSVVVATSAATPNAEQNNSGQNGDSNQEMQKQRVRRVACTCPNCAEGIYFYLNIYI